MVRRILGNGRTPLIIGALAVAAMALTVHQTGRIYPIGLSALLLGMLILGVLPLRGGSPIGAISGGLILAIAFRVSTNVFTTPIGASPQGQPRSIDRIIATGTIETGSPFYDLAPFHFLLTAAYSGVAGISAYHGIVLFSLLISLVLAAVTIGLLRVILVSDERALAVGVILALVTTEGLRRSYWVVPQVSATVMFWCVVLALALYVDRRSLRRFLPLAIMIPALGLTHKLPLVFLAAVFVVVLGLFFIDQVTWHERPKATPRQIRSLFLFITVPAVAQVLFVDLLDTIIRRIERLIDAFVADDPTAVRASTEPPSAAVEALPGIIAHVYEYPAAFMLFVERGHGIWLLLAAGTAWAVLFLTHRTPRDRQPLIVLLAVASVGVVLMVGGVVAIRGMNPTRPLVLMEPILVVLIVAAAWHYRRWLPRRRTALSVLVVLLLASQILAASAAPDYTNTPRYYADASEAHAKSTFCEVSVGEVYADKHFNRYAGADKQRCRGFTSFGGDQRSPLFNREITATDHPTIGIRTNVDVYLGEHDRWRLTWHPESELATEYHGVYDNAAVRFYHSATDA